LRYLLLTVFGAPADQGVFFFSPENNPIPGKLGY